MCGLSLLLVLAFTCSEFFPGFSGFPPSLPPSKKKKKSISKFQFDLDRGPTGKRALADVAPSIKYRNLFIFIILSLFQSLDTLLSA